MSINFDSNLDCLQDQVAGITATGLFSVCGWAQSTGAQLSDRVLFNISDLLNTNCNMSFGRRSVATTLFIGVNPGTGTPTPQTKVNFASSPAYGTWFFWALTNNQAGNLTGYWAALGDTSLVSVTTPSNAQTAEGGSLNIGSDDPGVATISWRGLIAALKVWNNVELTSAQLLQEMHTIRPIRWENLRYFAPMFGDGAAERDRGYPGNNVSPFSFTEFSTPANAAMPPGVAWGSQANPRIIT